MADENVAAETVALKLCRKCGVDFEPAPRNLLRGNWICAPCFRAHEKERRARRKAEGRPYRTGKVSREYHRAYAETYRTLPEVKARRSERARLRMLDPEERFKSDVRRQTRDAIRAGALTRQPCEVCGEAQVDAHHDDYGNPLDVRWLCRLHHRQHHLNAKANGGSHE